MNRLQNLWNAGKYWILGAVAVATLVVVGLVVANGSSPMGSQPAEAQAAEQPAQVEVETQQEIAVSPYTENAGANMSIEEFKTNATIGSANPVRIEGHYLYVLFVEEHYGDRVYKWYSASENGSNQAADGYTYAKGLAIIDRVDESEVRSHWTIITVITEPITEIGPQK